MLGRSFRTVEVSIGLVGHLKCALSAAWSLLVLAVECAIVPANVRVTAPTRDSVDRGSSSNIEGASVQTAGSSTSKIFDVLVSHY